MNFRLDDNYWRRERIIEIADKADKNNQSQCADCLRSTKGIENFEFRDNSLTISYDLRFVCLRAINKILEQYKFATNESVLYRIKNFIAEYREAIRVEEENIDYGWDVWVQDAYVSRYRLRRHGRRDDRVTNWRVYEKTSASANNTLQTKNSTQPSSGISPNG